AMPPPTPPRTRAPSRGREVVLIMVPRALGCRGGARPGRGSEGEVRRRHLGGVVAELQRGRSVRIGLLRRVVLVLVDLADGQQPLVDLAQRDRQGLLLRSGSGPHHGSPGSGLPGRGPPRPWVRRRSPSAAPRGRRRRAAAGPERSDRAPAPRCTRPRRSRGRSATPRRSRAARSTGPSP